MHNMGTVRPSLSPVAWMSFFFTSVIHFDALPLLVCSIAKITALAVRRPGSPV